MIVAEVKSPKVNKVEMAATRVDGTIETTATKLKANHMTITVTVNPILEQQLLFSPSFAHDATLG